MVKLKIYLGDLTYNTIVVSTEALPINIGYIASYCKKRFGSEVEFTLFKYHRIRCIVIYLMQNREKKIYIADY